MDHYLAEAWSEDFTGDTFVDVGANIGRYTLRCSPRFRKVLALEPWPATCADLMRNVAEANAKNVVVMNVGAGDVNGSRTMHGYSSGEANSLYSSHPVNGMACVSDQRASVLLMRVDELLLENDRLSFLKIDTEGHDVEALRGAMEIVRRDRPRVQVEMHREPDIATTIALLTEA